MSKESGQRRAVMEMPDPMKYAINRAALTGNIYVGRVNKAGTAFTDKKEQTDRAVRVVAEYILEEFGGGLVINYNDGTRFEIKVKQVGDGDA